MEGLTSHSSLSEHRPRVTSQSSCGLWLWVKLRVSDFNVCCHLLMNMWIKKKEIARDNDGKEEQKVLAVAQK